MDDHDFRQQYTPPTNATLLIDDASDDDYLGEPRGMPASHATQWIGDTWLLFKQQPGMWILAFVIYLAITIALQFIPFIGFIAQIFIAFILQAGFVYAGEKIRTEGAFELGDVFAGFQINLKSLLLLGLLYLVLFIALFALIFAFTGGSSALLLGSGDTEQELATMVGAGMGLSIVVLFIIGTLILSIAFFLAPTLIVLESEPVLQAIKLSLQAFGRNLVGALFCVLLSIVLCVVAMIPLGLGFLVVGPMMLLLPFTIYRDLFYREA
ncbi:BPSS1780 family membrane protein [Snodgrassella sp. CFCC 13594]|uniref:BPSS1780 family membrane protein n=1 Tax=Snodgrassella sp. CFCC 13594 TaxID=1775559 RepID=UPI000830F3CC|nr:BPSS1780 family membrane protein [Snodgrassella sp. CFCC 13594]